MNLQDIDRELALAMSQGAVRDITIPPCPELLLELRQEAQQADPDPHQVARIASGDVAMAAALIRMANSPVYARAQPAASVSEAISVLGLVQSVGILSAFLVKNAIPINTPLVTHFWETSTRRALAMGFIAKQLYGINADIAHTCGLFCHVGIPILLQGLRGYSGTFAEALARQDRSFTETENASHRTDHAVVGAIVAKTWRLPALVAVVVRLHHDFNVLSEEQIPHEARTLVAVTLLAEYLVAKHEGITEMREWDAYGQRCLDFIAVGAVEIEAWADSLHPVFDSVVVA